MGRIPRIIHQTYKTRALKPEWERSPAEWQRHHPTWEYRFWTDDDLRRLVGDHYTWFLPTYDAFPHHIQRVDVARSFILHRYGGVYSDCDIVPLRSMDAFLHLMEDGPTECEVALVETPNAMLDLRYSNSLMVSERHAPLWRHYWRYLMHRGWRQLLPWYFRFGMANTKHVEVIASTGPAGLSRVVQWLREDGGVLRLPTAMNVKEPPVLPSDIVDIDAVKAHHFVLPLPSSWVNDVANVGARDDIPLAAHDANGRGAKGFEMLQGGTWCDRSTSFLVGCKYAWERRDVLLWLPLFVLLVLWLALLSRRLHVMNRAVVIVKSRQRRERPAMRARR